MRFACRPDYQILTATLVLLVLTPTAPADRRAELLPDPTPLASALADRFVSREEGRVRLRFSMIILNRGSGPLAVMGRRKNGVMKAYQRIYRMPGKSYREVPIGAFHYHSTHRHWHLLQVAEYRLKDAQGVVVSRSDKISFCLRDTSHIEPNLPGSPSKARYGFCTREPRAARVKSGVSVGWGDHYGPKLPGQWVDITGLPPGEYALEVEVDPDGLIREADRSNNTASVPVTLD